MPVTHLECTRCGRRFPPRQAAFVCGCGAPLYPRYDLAQTARELRREHLASREPSLWRYAEVLPVDAPADRVSLGEGFTPLLEATRLGTRTGVSRLLIKDESANPTGSFKARGLAVAVSMAKVLGATDVCLPSAGNAGSALAAYAAAAGLKAHVFLPRDIARLFVMETESYGAEVVMVDGLITDAGRICAEQARRNGWYDCATLKEPYRVEGKKTMGYEIAEQLAWRLPDAVLYPTGGGTGLVGMWKAFEEMEAMGWIGPERPRMYAVQADGCAPIVRAFDAGQDTAAPWEGASTLAHGLRVPRAIADFIMLRVLRESGGGGVTVSDTEMIRGVKDAAAAEGVFMAPEGGACVAALRKLVAAGVVAADETVVLFSTGTGFKYVENMSPLW